MMHYIRAYKKNKKYKITSNNRLQKPEKYGDYEIGQKLKFVGNFKYPMNLSNILKFGKTIADLKYPFMYLICNFGENYIVSSYHETQSKKIKNHVDLFLAQDHYIVEGDKRHEEEENRSVIKEKCSGMKNSYVTARKKRKIFREEERPIMRIQLRIYPFFSRSYQKSNC